MNDLIYNEEVRYACYATNVLYFVYVYIFRDRQNFNDLQHDLQHDDSNQINLTINNQQSL